MSTSDFIRAEVWGGRSVARRVAEVSPRCRAVVTGTICSVGISEHGGAASFTCVLSDGSGEIGLVFVGREIVLGLRVGTRCTVEGTARMESDQLVIWNPFYRLEPPDERGEPITSERRHE